MHLSSSVSGTNSCQRFVNRSMSVCVDAYADSMLTLEFLAFSSVAYFLVHCRVAVCVVGWLTDNTHTYNVSFVASGIVICCSGFLLLAAPLLRRCDHIAVKSDDNTDHEASSSKAAASDNHPSTSWNSN